MNLKNIMLSNRNWQKKVLSIWIHLYKTLVNAKFNSQWQQVGLGLSGAGVRMGIANKRKGRTFGGNEDVQYHACGGSWRAMYIYQKSNKCYLLEAIFGSILPILVISNNDPHIFSVWLRSLCSLNGLYAL